MTNEPSPAWDELCTECNEPRHRHHAPAYADHPWTNRPQPAPKPEETA